MERLCSPKKGLPDIMSLRQLAKEGQRFAAQTGTANAALPRLAACLVLRRDFAYHRRSGQLPHDKDVEDEENFGKSPPPGDTEDLAPSTFEGPDAQKPAGVKAGVSARPQPRYQRGHPNVTIPEGQPSAPDFEKELSRDPHEANIPVYPGLNIKSQEDLTKKDPRLPPSGLDKVEKPPGNWPSTSTAGHAGFSEDPPASSVRAAGDPDAGKVDKDAPGLEDQDPRTGGSPSPGSEADPSTERAPGAYGNSSAYPVRQGDEGADPRTGEPGIRWNEKPDTRDIPHTTYQSR